MLTIKTLLLALALALPAFGQQNTNLTSFPAWSSALTNYTPSKASFAARVDVRAGYGINLTSQSQMQAVAAAISISPSLSFGAVAAHDAYGWQIGGLTVGVNGSMNVPWIGRVDCFAGDGVAYDTKYHSAANYLFIGAERPFMVGNVRLSPGVSLANTSTRAGTVFFVGLGFRF